MTTSVIAGTTANLPGYAIVIATRNRAHALSASIPRMINQSHPPAELILADSSDDHTAIIRVVKEAVGTHPVKLTILHTERGAAIQRNIGLEHVTQPIVFFPDDDSIFFPLAAESICQAYQRDIGIKISAVCAAESTTPPPDFPLKKASYRMSATDRLKQRLLGFRTSLEKKFVPDPIRFVGREYVLKTALPAWTQELDVAPVESMTGFRMTFRTEVIRRIKFDANLKRYSLLEDRDASLAAWKYGAVVAARRAKIFHYRSPENRDNGRRLGAQHILNPAYVVAKHTPPGHLGRRYVRRFCYYKSLLYLLTARGKFGRERFQGALRALRQLPWLIAIETPSAAETYQRAMEACRPDEK